MVLHVEPASALPVHLVPRAAVTSVAVVRGLEAACSLLGWWPAKAVARTVDSVMFSQPNLHAVRTAAVGTAAGGPLRSVMVCYMEGSIDAFLSNTPAKQSAQLRRGQHACPKHLPEGNVSDAVLSISCSDTITVFLSLSVLSRVHSWPRGRTEVF
jgi:hypothetical protein